MMGFSFDGGFAISWASNGFGSPFAVFDGDVGFGYGW